MTSVRVLFLCTGNSARSILAEALLRHAGRNAFDVHSAGTAPKGVNPFSLRVLAARGVDTTGLASKPASLYEGQSFDYVITRCDDAAENCPVFPGATRRLHWGFPDPATVEGSEADKLVPSRPCWPRAAPRELLHHSPRGGNDSGRLTPRRTGRNDQRRENSKTSGYGALRIARTARRCRFSRRP